MPLIIAEIEKSSRERIRISLDQFRGRDTVDVRVWYADGEDWKPSKSGVTTTVSNLPALAAGVERAVAQARDMGLIKE